MTTTGFGLKKFLPLLLAFLLSAVVCLFTEIYNATSMVPSSPDRSCQFAAAIKSAFYFWLSIDRLPRFRRLRLGELCASAMTWLGCISQLQVSKNYAHTMETKTSSCDVPWWLPSVFGSAVGPNRTEMIDNETYSAVRSSDSFSKLPSDAKQELVFSTNPFVTLPWTRTSVPECANIVSKAHDKTDENLNAHNSFCYVEGPDSYPDSHREVKWASEYRHHPSPSLSNTWICRFPVAYFDMFAHLSSNQCDALSNTEQGTPLLPAPNLSSSSNLKLPTSEADQDESAAVPRIDPTPVDTTIADSRSNHHHLTQNNNATGKEGGGGRTQRRSSQNRFNYASNSCGARVLSANSEAIDPTAVIHSSKSRYMLNPCLSKDKWIVIELCDRMAIDQIRIGNFEYFSSMFQHVQVEASTRYPTTNWTLLGSFVVPNVRTFHSLYLNRESTQHLKWFKYVRSLFQSHYGQQFYCPVTEVQVYGLPLSEELQSQLHINSHQHPTLEQTSAQVNGAREMPGQTTKQEDDKLVDWTEYLDYRNYHRPPSNSSSSIRDKDFPLPNVRVGIKPSSPPGEHSWYPNNYYSNTSSSFNNNRSSDSSGDDSSPVSSREFLFVEPDDDSPEFFQDDTEDNSDASKPSHQFLQAIKLIQSVSLHLRQLQLEHFLLANYVNYSSPIIKNDLQALHDTLSSEIGIVRDDLSSVWTKTTQIVRENEKNYELIVQLRAELKWYLCLAFAMLGVFFVLSIVLLVCLRGGHFPGEHGRFWSACNASVIRENCHSREKKRDRERQPHSIGFGKKKTKRTSFTINS